MSIETICTRISGVSESEYDVQHSDDWLSSVMSQQTTTKTNNTKALISGDNETQARDSRKDPS